MGIIMTIGKKYNYLVTAVELRNTKAAASSDVKKSVF
jgi:hypothetical protein